MICYSLVIIFIYCSIVVFGAWRYILYISWSLLYYNCGQPDLADALKHLTNPKVAINVMNIGRCWQQCGLFIYAAGRGSPAPRDLTLCLPSLICQLAAPPVAWWTRISDNRVKAEKGWCRLLSHRVWTTDMFPWDNMSFHSMGLVRGLLIQDLSRWQVNLYYQSLSYCTSGWHCRLAAQRCWLG